MAILDFPENPTLYQIFVKDNETYVWNGSIWATEWDGSQWVEKTTSVGGDVDQILFNGTAGVVGSPDLTFDDDTSTLTVNGAIASTTFVGNTFSGTSNNSLNLGGQPSSYYLANSSYTSSDILSKLLNVDGSGSSLDSDLLDGYHASAFALLTGANFTGLVDANVGGGVASSSPAIRAKNNTHSISIYGRLGAGNYTTVTQADDSALIFTQGSQNTGGLVIAPWNNSGYGLRLASNGSFTVNGQTSWHAGNDGSGSGLDADTLDGLNSSAFAQLSGATFTGAVSVTGTTYLGQSVITGNGVSTGSAAFELGGSRTGDGWTFLDFHSAAGNDFETRLLRTGGVNGDFEIYNLGAGNLNIVQANSAAIRLLTSNQERFKVNSNGSIVISNSLVTANGNVIWHAGNDGAGSGLDADTIDGLDSSIFVRTDVAGIQTINSNLLIGVGAASTSEGGELVFAKAPSGTSTTNPYIDVYNDSFRMVASPGGVTKVLTFPFEAGSVWHTGNDGSGSGLDADTVDGIQASAFAQLTGANFSGTIALGAASLSNVISINANLTRGHGNVTRYGIQNLSYIDNTTGALTADRSAYGVYNLTETSVQNDQAFTLTAYGARNEARTSGTGGNTLDGEGVLYGSYNYALHQTADVTYNRLEQAIGSYNMAVASGNTAYVDNAYGAYAVVRPTNAGATVNNGFLFYGTNSTVTGTFNNRYGVFIVPAINNYFAGGVQVGGTASGGTSALGVGIGVAPPGTSGALATSNTASFGGAVTIQGGTAWHAGNDGSGSGLDADTVDGIQASAFAQLTGATFTSDVIVSNGATRSARFTTDGAIELFSTGGAYIDLKNASGDDYDVRIQQTGASGLTITSPDGVTITGNGTWTGLGLNQLAASGTVTGNAYIDFRNENTIPTSSVHGHTHTDGSGWLDFSVTATGSRTADRRYSAFYADQSGFLLNNGNIRTTGVDGMGLAFWNDSSYKIYMSSAGNATWGGRVVGETTSDYNMYFRMSGGTNRGFVFQSGTNSEVGIDSGGHIRTDGYVTSSTHLQVAGGSASTWYNMMIRNDGSQVYLLSSAVQTTKSAAMNATWNNFRPLHWNLSTGAVSINSTNNGSTSIGGTSVTINGGTAWHSGNDGSGSGLDADTLDGWQLADIVKNDGGQYNIRISALHDLVMQCAGTSVSNDIWSPPIELREVNWIGNGSTASSYAPGITFHWSQVSASAIKMYSDASIRFIAQGSTGGSYRNTWHHGIYAHDWIRPQGDHGIYWDGRARGINVADAGASYGNITTWGTGVNAWNGYSIGSWVSFMANGSGAGSTRGFYSQDDGFWLCSWDDGGNATFPANITAYSDERLKKNMRAIDNVEFRRSGMALAAMIYERDGKTRIGFGAQTLEKAVPEVVITAPDLVGTKSVNYSDMVAILAVDADNQAKRIEELEKENKYMRNVIALFEERLVKAGL